MTFSNLIQKLVAPFQQASKQTRGIFLVTAFIMLTGNFSLFERILEIYPLTWHHLPFLISLVIFFSILCALFFLLISHGKATRWILALFLIIASQTAYYMDKFGVIIDVVMMDNILQTNRQEFAGLMTGNLLVRTIIFGLIPAWLVIKYFPKVENTYEEFKSRLKISGVFVLAIVLIIAPFTSSYFSFWREHKITRFYANPTYTVYSVIKYVTQQINIAKIVPLKHDCARCGNERIAIKKNRIDDYGGGRNRARRSFFVEWLPQRNQSAIGQARCREFKQCDVLWHLYQCFCALYVLFFGQKRLR
jgi:lipid A ethanolaminephosphotransferase